MTIGTIGAGVVSIDAEARISTMNPSAQRYLGVPAGAGVIVAKLADAVRHPEILDVIENLSKPWGRICLI